MANITMRSCFDDSVQSTPVGSGDRTVDSDTETTQHSRNTHRKQLLES